MAGITINPGQVTNALGSFYTTSEGYVQGTALNDPAVRYWLAQGLVGLGVTTPMWGGEAITDSLTTPSSEASNIGSIITLATAEANITGFTVFDQATAMVQSAQSPVPLAAAGMSINFYRLGSGARIAVGIAKADAVTLEGSASNTTVYWDYTNQVLLLSGSGALPVKVLDVNVGGSQTVSYSSGTGFGTWVTNGSTAIIQI